MRKFIKISAAAITLLILLLAIAYWVIVNNAATLIADAVESNSGGKISVSIKKLKLNFSDYGLDAKDVRFFTKKTDSTALTYDIQVERLRLRLSDLGALVFHKKILADTIICIRPLITVNKWKEPSGEKFSLPGQMGRIYDGLNEALDKMNIHYCLIDSGAFVLNDMLNRNNPPVQVTDFYLRIDNFGRDTGKGDAGRFLYSDRIKFYSSGQNISFSDGRHGIRYKKLRINSFKKTIEIDSCYLYEKSREGVFNRFNIYFDTLRLASVDFTALAQRDLIRADSAICINPSLDLDIELKEGQRKKGERRHILSKDSMQQAVRNLLGDVDLKYAGLVNARIEVRTKLNDKINTYLARRNNLTLENVTIVKDSTVPLAVGEFRLNMYGYAAYDPDSTYAITFDSILFRNDKIDLSAFSLRPTAKNKHKDHSKDIRMKSLQIEDISWYELLGNKRLEAGIISMIDPVIMISTAGTVRSPAQRKPLYQSFRNISERLDLSRLRIVNGDFELIHDGETRVSLQGLSTEMKAEQLLESRSLNELFGSLDKVIYGQARIFGGYRTLNFKDGLLLGKKKIMAAKLFSLVEKNEKALVMLNDVRMDGFEQKEDNYFHLGTIDWQEGYMTFHADTHKPTGENRGESRQSLRLTIDSLDGQHTTVVFKKNGLLGSVNMHYLRSSGINWESGKSPEIRDLVFSGDKINLSSGRLHLTGGEFFMGENGFIHDARLDFTGRNHRLIMDVPSVAFRTSHESFIAGKPVVSDIVIREPSVQINENPVPVTDVIANEKQGAGTFTLEGILLENPKFSAPLQLGGFLADLSHSASSWQINRLLFAAGRMDMDSMYFSVRNFSGQTAKMDFDLTGSSLLEAAITDLSVVGPRYGAPGFSAVMPFVRTGGITLRLHPKEDTRNTLNMDSFHLENMVLRNASGAHTVLEHVMSNSPDLKIGGGHTMVEDTVNDIRLAGWNYDHRVNTLTLDSFSFLPLQDKESYNSRRGFQSDYLQLSAPRMVLKGFSPVGLFSDSVFRLNNLYFGNPGLYVYKDKRLPFAGGILKPLPTARFQQMSKKFIIDSLSVQHASVIYEEMNEKTMQEGQVRFSELNALVRNIRNAEAEMSDSLRLSAEGLFMDSARLRMRFSESYLDSLHGFTLAVRLSPFELSSLNPLLEPLASVKVLSGRLDTLRMNAIGRDHLAYGKMSFYYHGLKSRILKEGNENKTSFSLRLMNFAANNFIIRKNNSKGYGDVFYERDPERSIFHYWTRMVLSGVISSTGIKSNRGIEKKYENAKSRLGVPDIPDSEP